MAHKEAAFSNQHSAVSENQRSLTTESTEEGKTVPLIQGKTGQVNADEQERVQQRAEALALKLAQTYEELTRLLERNPGVKRQITEGEAKEDKVYQKLKQRLSPQPAQNRRGPGIPWLKLADLAPRCRWVRQDGTSCGSPQMKNHIYCFAHRQMAEARTLLLMLPAPEDANAIQVGLMRIQKALIEDTISTKKAGLLLYSMQLALTNVGQTTFGQAKDEEMVTDTVDEEEAFSQNKTLPLMNADDTDKEEDLRRMNADEGGLGNGGMEVEWKPKADMYRMDTLEAMEAYEASFRMKIEPRLSAERRPVVAPGEPAEVHASLG